MSNSMKIYKFIEDSLLNLAIPLGLALAAFSLIYTPFLYYTSEKKQKFINKTYPNSKSSRLGFSTNYAAISVFAYATTLMILFSCITTYDNIRLYLAGRNEKGIVIAEKHIEKHQIPVDGSPGIDLDYYLISLQGRKSTCTSQDSVKIGSLIKYRMISGSEIQ